MAIDKNTITNLPGVDDEQMDRLIALDVACEVVGPPADAKAADAFVHEFSQWLKASIDAADRLVRRAVLLTVTRGRSAIPDRDVVKLRKLVEDIYRRT